MRKVLPIDKGSDILLYMIKNGTWKSEPASEEHWEVDWSIAEPDPEYVEREAYREIYQTNNQSKEA